MVRPKQSYKARVGMAKHAFKSRHKGKNKENKSVRKRVTKLVAPNVCGDLSGATGNNSGSVGGPGDPGNNSNRCSARTDANTTQVLGDITTRTNVSGMTLPRRTFKQLHASTYRHTDTLQTL